MVMTIRHVCPTSGAVFLSTAVFLWLSHLVFFSFVAILGSLHSAAEPLLSQARVYRSFIAFGLLVTI